VKHAAIILLIELRGCSIKVFSMNNDNHKHKDAVRAAALHDDETAKEIYERGQHEFEEYLREQQSKPRLTITATELCRRIQTPLTVYCPHFAIAGALTIVAGDPKVGKTTLLLHLLNAVTTGGRFLGEQCPKVNALYATEQSSIVFKEQLVKVPSIAENKKLHIIPLEMNCDWEEDGCWDDGSPRYSQKPIEDWPQQVESWRRRIIETNAKILVVDTLVSFANLESGESFDAGVMTRIFMGLKSLFTTRPDLAIIVLHHLRKGDGARPKPIRSFADVAGSYALRAATDQNVVMFAPEPKHHPTRRRILVEGRFDEPYSFDVELGEGGYQPLVNRAEPLPAGRRDMQGEISEAVRADPQLAELSDRKLADKLKVTVHQVRVFRDKSRTGRIEQAVPNPA
jgi:hypothetical protein